MNEDHETHKSHHLRHSGRKAEKKKAKVKHVQELTAKQRNPKAFAVQSAEKAARKFRRSADLKTKKEHIPLIDRSPVEPPPIVISIVGPPKVGKTTLMRCLIKHYVKQNLSVINGPVTVVSGKKKRLTIIECNNDINTMIDIAKISDLVLLLVDASFGFEMETFEFLNICQVHGFPRIMGVLTHLDVFKRNKKLQKTKKMLKHRFWTEIYQGAKLFYMSGLHHGEYLKRDVQNLGRFISVMRFRPLQWRMSHPYLLCDRMEDLTDPEIIRRKPKDDRNVCLYGYLRGTHLKPGINVHIPGCGDYSIQNVQFLPDPCPLPEKEKRRSLNEKERLIYAPMSGVGGIVYDKDAVYIDVGGSHSHVNPKDDSSSHYFNSLIESQHTIDSKIQAGKFSLFTGAEPLNEDKINRLDIPSNETEIDKPLRRKVKFADEVDEKAISSDEESDDDDQLADDDDLQSDEDDDDADDGFNNKDDEDSNDDDEAVEYEESDDDDQEEIGSTKWKEDLAKKASDAFYQRQQSTTNLQKLVYGSSLNDDKQLDEDEDEDEVELGGLFRVSLRTQEDKVSAKSSLNSLECTKFHLANLHVWDDQLKNKIRDIFVTGKWKDQGAGYDAADNDDDVFGDFEDFETGEVSKNNDSASDEEEAAEEDTKDEDEKRAIKKKKLKEAFDMEYDDQEGKTYYDELKAEMEEQSQLNRSEFEDLDDSIRIQYEGYRPGMYIRVELNSVPYEFVNNFDPSYPVIMGGLKNSEHNLGYIQVRIKKHRWYKRILKSRDPLIISMGWRRIQTVLLYSLQDHNGRNRLLKYTPQHMHCNATFWGPITPQGNGLLGVQTVSAAANDFRISATGVVVELDKSTKIEKKLKLVGNPIKIYKKTAFVKGMFTSALEVTKFEGASIRTVSGIRGQIKKAIRAPIGAFRATFEDKILLSDIVFMRTWCTVFVPRFCVNVYSLLLPIGEKHTWTGMRTVGQIRKEEGLSAPVNQDSLYLPIERKNKTFQKLQISKALQRDLPYKDKPKNQKVKADGGMERVAVIREPNERKVANLMTSLKVLYKDKRHTEKLAMIKRVKEHKKVLKSEQAKRIRREKNLKKRIFKAIQKVKKN